MPSKSKKNSGPSQRMLRVGELIRHELSTFLMRVEIADPVLAGQSISVSEVRVTSDLRLATAFVMPLGGENAELIVDALNRHKKFIRGQVTPKLDFKFAPEIRFMVDQTFAEANRIDALLRSENVARDLNHHDDEADQQ